ncbi:hypothetical protein QU487_09100 [Crenobacter sp. SG2305]|uniref:hypothetical protein n=1 Tax=Crenobacter oryzisoli TaxID=3056844 RepID=UPI0025AB4438|nr:hypothetical protein [Crenobacter sp. SG2305]MDN0082911.1 hypothetical protein [Crenobacter sp. SG2305]
MADDNWRQRLAEGWQQLSARLPIPHRDGVSLPQTLLLSSLQKRLDPELARCEALTLDTEHLQLQLAVTQPIHARLFLSLRPASIDWPSRTLALDYRLQGMSTSPSRLRRAVSRPLLEHLDSRIGRQLLGQLLKDLPWLRLEGERLIIALDRIDTLNRWLKSPLFGQNLADRFALAELRTENGALRLVVRRLRGDEE